MKRVLTILAILLLPLSVWAMTPITDSALSDVTGQAGVSIALDLTMDVNIGTVAWGDEDGISDYWSTYVGAQYAGTPTTGGWVGVNGLFINDLTIQARAATDGWNGYTTFGLKPLTIDVATDTSGALYDAGTTFVRIGLGALAISMDSLTLTAALGDGADWDAEPVLDQELGSVNIGDLDVYLNPLSYVDIYAHNGSQGVNITMDVVVDRLELGYVSWGDDDGVSDAYGDLSFAYRADLVGSEIGAGYVGLNTLNLGSYTDPAVTVSGTVAIDVLTTYGGYYAVLPYALDSWREEAAYNPLDPDTTRLANIFATMYADPTYVSSTNGWGPVPSVSVVHISFPADMSVAIGVLRSQVALSNVASLADLNPVESIFTGIMGDIYLQQIDLTINAGSWVDIWAH